MSYIKRVYSRLKKIIFSKQFAKFSIHASVGLDGCGKGCRIEGADRICIEDDVYVSEGVEIIALKGQTDNNYDPEIIIGKNTRIHARARITSAGRIIIEDNVLIAPEVFITDHNHGMNPETKGGYSRQKLIVKSVSIGDGTWLGQRVCVLPGVSIGKHCIIGAGSVCTHNIPEYCIAVGVPARVIKKWDPHEKQWRSIDE